MNASEGNTPAEREFMDAVAAQESQFARFLDSGNSVTERIEASRHALQFQNAETIERTSRIARDPSEELPLRAAALSVAANSIEEGPGVFDLLLEILNNPDQPVQLRRTALLLMDATRIMSPVVDLRRAEYMAALRALLDDKDKLLRHRAVETLAMEGDEATQRRLLEGIEKRSNKLVGITKAIQLLGYDVHGEFYPVLRDIVQNPPSKSARLEAIRLLAGDPGSRQLLAEIFSNQNEETEARRLSAIGTQLLSPKEFEESARRVIEDDGEDEALQASCTSALIVRGDFSSLANEERLRDRMAWLHENAKTKQLREAATQYTNRFGK